MVKTDSLPIFLKSIYIQGFKSFADPVRLELGKGLSVVVGPNGSGKSNVADAVRWVLGEQSAKSLRGTKMEDVIFVGSSKRRPVGMAEVSLVFDNSTGIFPLDFQEVIITRKVYRDGEGQYFINKAPCRLKDIQELFMDTGAGKEGFSIIGQGRVEEILTLKSEERRTLIEEAAGITKFRSRKREALRRLEDTEKNLQRLEDILEEVSGQLTPLADQAEVAKRSLFLAEEKRNLEIQLVVADLSEIEAKLVSGRDEEKILKEKQAASEGELAKAEGQGLQDRLKLDEAEEEVQKQQKEVFEAEQGVNSLKHEHSLQIERKRHFEEQIKKGVQEIAAAEDKSGKIKEFIKAVKDKQTILKLTVDEARSKIIDQENRLSLLRSKNGTEEFEKLKADLFEKLSEQSSCSNDITRVSQTISSLEEQALQITRERQQKEHEFLIRNQLEKEINELKDIENKNAHLSEKVLIVKQNSSTLEQQIQQEHKTLESEIRELDKLKAKWQALKNFEDSLEGYQRGVREVMLAHKKGIQECRGLCGTVADLISVEKKYEVAIETAAGAALQSIVAESLESAKNSIKYLKSRQLGRATFLPLDEIKGYRISINDEVRNDPGFVGLAVDLVSFRETFKAAIESVLGRIIVTDNIDSAARAARLTGYRIRIVTLDGDQIHPGGSLTGGSTQRRDSNLLSRSREIKELNSKVEELEKTIKVKQQNYNHQLEQRKELEEALKSLEAERQNLRERQTALKVSSDNLKIQIRRVEEDLRMLENRKNELTTRSEELQRQLIALQEKLIEVEKESDHIRQELTQREEAAKKTDEEIEELAEEIMQAKVQLAKWEEEYSQTVSQLAREQTIDDENENEIEQRKKAIQALEETVEKIDGEAETLMSQIEELSLRQKNLQYNLTLMRQKKEELSAGVTELDKQIQLKRQENQAFEQKLHALEVRTARLDTEWDAGLNRLTEFSLTWEEASSLKSQQDRGVLRQRVQDIKGQIEELGPTNQAAIEEYPKMLQRYEFLKGQHDDLVEAGKTLRELIAELDKTMSERFKAGFVAVNQAFKEVFSELFTGGHAELRLVDPENLLDTGVEIIAQPPGKKPQLLSLLSGGERALTAIALLFALLKVKPSPFCILDEIEASLDDANVKRFAQYVHSLSHSTQFIVISHRKGTMESADVLYGITMEESGVSKLLTVKLEEPLEDTASA